VLFPLTRFANLFIFRLYSAENWRILRCGKVSIEKLQDLEVRVRKLVDLVRELKHANACLQQDLYATRERLIKQEELSHDWEEERTNIRSRIEKVLGELDFLECQEAELQGVLRDEAH